MTTQKMPDLDLEAICGECGVRLTPKPPAPGGGTLFEPHECPAKHPDLEAIKARCDLADPAPWHEADGHIGRPKGAPIIAVLDLTVVQRSEPLSHTLTSPNADFIAHARTDVPALVAEVERLREALKRIATQCVPEDHLALLVARAALAGTDTTWEEDPSMTEAQLSDAVVDLAHALGWSVRPARTERGWRTPVAADGAGWPDLTLVRTRLIVVELKRMQGHLSREQSLWAQRLNKAGVEFYVWYPTHWVSGLIEEVLRRET